MHETLHTPEFLIIYMFVYICRIWYPLYKLKNAQNTHGGVLLLVAWLSKLAEGSRNFSHCFFMYFFLIRFSWLHLPACLLFFFLSLFSHFWFYFLSICLVLVHWACISYLPSEIGSPTEPNNFLFSRIDEFFSFWRICLFVVLHLQ